MELGLNGVRILFICNWEYFGVGIRISCDEDLSQATAGEKLRSEAINRRQRATKAKGREGKLISSLIKGLKECFV